MKKGKISSEFKSRVTNNEIYDNLFDTCIKLLNEDTEIALELTNETAPPDMSFFKDE